MFCKGNYKGYKGYKKKAFTEGFSQEVHGGKKLKLIDFLAQKSRHRHLQNETETHKPCGERPCIDECS